MSENETNNDLVRQIDELQVMYDAKKALCTDPKSELELKVWRTVELGTGLMTTGEFRKAMEEFAEEYPAMATWLLALETRVFERWEASAQLNEELSVKWLFALV